MKIISWNCNMAFARKSDEILKLKPDLLIVQECSEKDIQNIDSDFKYWIGKNKNKGLGVLGFGNHKFGLDNSLNSEITWTIPVAVDDLNVLAIWTYKLEDEKYYVEVAKKAKSHYHDFLTDKNSIFIGDFNNNVIWDKTNKDELKWINFIKSLEEINLVSLYHHAHNETHGMESKNTLFMNRDSERGYHIDYVFGSKEIAKLAKVDFGSEDDWLQLSDHMPLILDF